MIHNIGVTTKQSAVRHKKWGNNQESLVQKSSKSQLSCHVKTFNSKLIGNAWETAQSQLKNLRLSYVLVSIAGIFVFISVWWQLSLGLGLFIPVISVELSLIGQGYGMYSTFQLDIHLEACTLFIFCCRIVHNRLNSIIICMKSKLI